MAYKILFCTYPVKHIYNTLKVLYETYSFIVLHEHLFSKYETANFEYLMSWNRSAMQMETLENRIF